MDLLFKFDRAIVTAKIYDELLVRLEEAGAGSPAGRLYHVCAGSSDRLHVFDVWDSARHFQEFADALVPTLGELGVALLEPDVWPVYNIIKPRRATAWPRPFLVKFEPRGMSTRHYNEIMKYLDESGFAAPPERLYQVCYREDDDLRVISIWRSTKAFRVFFDQLIHISLDLRIPEVPLTELVVEDIHHIIDGSPLGHPGSRRKPS